MESDLQKKLMTLFKYSLNPDGIILLGTAETLSNQSDGFIEIDNKFKIYSRTSFPMVSELNDFPSSLNNHRANANELPASSKVGENVQALFDQVLLQRFAPAGVFSSKCESCSMLHSGNHA